MSKDAVLPRLRFPGFKDKGAINLENGNVIFRPINNKNHNSDLPVLAISQEHGAIPREWIDYNVSVSEKSLKNYKVVEVGDFIISLRSFEGGIEYSTRHGICSPAYIILRKSCKIVEQYYKYYFKTDKYIQDLNKDLEGIRDGKMVSYSQFSAILIPLPDNKEQQKIADCLSSLDDLITAENEKLEALKTHKKGLMQKLFPTEGKTVPQLRFEGYTDAWEQRKLGDVCIVGDIDHWMPKTVNNGIPYLMTGDFIGINELGFLKAKQISYDDYIKLSKRIKPEKGDLLFARYASIGLVRYITTERKFLVSYSCAIIKPIDVNGEFAFYQIQTKGMQQNIEININASSQRNIGIDSINKLDLLLPNKEEQATISNFFRNLDRLIVAQTEKIEALKLHKKGLMQGLFPSAQEVMG